MKQLTRITLNPEVMVVNPVFGGYESLLAQL